MRAAAILLLSLCLLVSASVLANANGAQTKYFAWAALKSEPVKLSDPMSPDEASAREAAGEAYYVATYDERGRLRSLEKRLKGTSLFTYTYEYANGQPTRTVTRGTSEP